MLLFLQNPIFIAICSKFLGGNNMNLSYFENSVCCSGERSPQLSGNKDWEFPELPAPAFLQILISFVKQWFEFEGWIVASSDEEENKTFFEPISLGR